MSKAKDNLVKVKQYREVMRKRREMFLKARQRELEIIEGLTSADAEYITELGADDTPPTVN